MSLLSKRITLDFPDVPPAFIERAARVVSMLVHEAADLYGSPAVATITPLVEEQDNGEQI